MVQKSVGLKIEAPVCTVAADADTAHVLDGAQGLALCGAKGTEVVLAQQVLCGGFHRGQVQRPKHPANPARFQTGPHG